MELLRTRFLCCAGNKNENISPPSPFVFFVNILITSIFNWTLWSFWQGRGIYPSMRRFCDNLVVILLVVCVCVIWLWWFKNHLKTPNFLAYAWGSKGSEPYIRPLYCPSSRSPNPIPACQGDGASWRGFLAQLPHLYPWPSLTPALGKEAAVSEYLCKLLSSWQRGMADSISGTH